MQIDIKSIMTHRVNEMVLVDEVQTCDRISTLKEVVETLRRHRIGSIVIVENKKPVGIFTERDYLMKVAGNGFDDNVEIIEKYMTPNPQCVTEQDSVGKVFLKMQMGRFRHLVVVDAKGDLVNIISIKDVMDFIVSCPSTEKR